MDRKRAIFLHNVLPRDCMEAIDNHLVRMLPDTMIDTPVRHEIEDRAELLAMKRYAKKRCMFCNSCLEPAHVYWEIPFTVEFWACESCPQTPPLTFDLV